MGAFKKLIRIVGRLVLFVLFILGVSNLIMMIVIPIYYNITGNKIGFGQGVNFLSEGELIFSTILSNISIVIAVFITYKIFQEKDQISLGLKEKSFLKKGVEGLVWGIILITIPFLLVLLLGSIKIVNVNLNTMAIKSLGKAVLLYLFVAIGEEVMSRGYIHGLLKRYYGSKAAIIVTSLIFSFLHILNENFLQNPLPFISLFIAGILFGVSREVTGGLWIPIGIHFTWNLFQGNIYGFEVSGMNFGLSILEIERVGHPLITGAEFGLEGSLLTTIFLVLATYIHWWYYKKKEGPGNLSIHTTEL